MLVVAVVSAGTTAVLVLGLSTNRETASAGGLGPESSSRIVRSTFWSASLEREMPFQVYLPQGYDSGNTARYPVLYMLHGLGGNQTDWENEGLFLAATQLIAAGEIPPMIIVTPSGESGYWMDHAENGPRFGSYVSKDLVSLIDRNYRTLAGRSTRAIGGMSMGGHGALQLAFNNPDEFGIVGAHSVALRRKDQAFSFFGDMAYFQAHDPVSMVQKSPSVARRFTLSIDIGRSDQWNAAATQFHNQLMTQNVQHSWSNGSGGHDGAYWSSHVGDYLRFYGDAFEAATAVPAA
jgi:S-formylglutathione hydrolase FrmB